MTPLRRIKQFLVGTPLANERLEHEKLSKKTALAVLSSDAISSVAYGTDQILLVLVVLGAAALNYVLPISAVIVGLLVLVGLSYRQTVFAYPQGGGSYTVARENLGQRAGLVAAAATSNVTSSRASRRGSSTRSDGVIDAPLYEDIT